MKTFEVRVRMQVADKWIADGFDLNERKEEIADAFTAMLPYAYEREVNVDVLITKSPTGEQISDLQDGTVEAKD
jgi:hypothetical protein